MAVGYLQVFVKIWDQCQIEWKERGPTSTFMTDFFNDISNYSYITASDIIICLMLGVVFTILRYVLTLVVFKPLSRWFQFIEKDRQKFPESCFKVLFYSSACGYCTYILFNGKYSLYQDTSTCWIGWYKGMSVPLDIYVLYVVEAGFYFHSIYATFFMDLWRRDSILMVLHHVLANLLILFSFAIRYHRIGVLVLFLHDNCDVFLEWTKICVCLKSRGGKYHKMPDMLSTLGFILFASSWFICRLYLYPIKVLRSTGYADRPHLPTAPFYFFFNAMLWTLFLMNAWWFTFIVWLVIRIVSGQSREVEDVREIPKHAENSSAVKMAPNGKKFGNGDVPSYGVKNDHQDNIKSKDNKRMDENGEIVDKDMKEPFRRRQPRTKPANP